MDKFIGKAQLAEELGINKETLRRKVNEKIGGYEKPYDKLLSPSEADYIRKKLLHSFKPTKG
ncbi:MAG: hypothetical protein HC831_08310 [Chloroflexia bacterium]|nr:hypothetical protein [Chloroflexia bacterium]